MATITHETLNLSGTILLLFFYVISLNYLKVCLNSFKADTHLTSWWIQEHLKMSKSYCDVIFVGLI